MNVWLLTSTVLFALSMGIPELLDAHAFSEKMISHHFKYWPMQVFGFVLMAVALFALGTPAAVATGVGVFLVPVTDVFELPHKLHVAAAGLAFAGVFVMAVLYSATPVQLALTVLYPLAVIGVSQKFNAVVQEKVAAACAVAWLAAYAAGL